MNDRCLETYLQEIDEVKLLNAEQEVELGRKVKAGDNERASTWFALICV